jgi:hypothetical protein
MMQVPTIGGTNNITHLQGLLVHLLCHAAQVAHDVACLAQVELQVRMQAGRRPS